MASTANLGTPVDGAVALVTGGNRGLGRALVDELVGRGAQKVYAASRAGEPIQDPRIAALRIDVGDQRSVDAAAAAAQDVSILINNAAVSLGTPVLEASMVDIEAELDTNLFGILRVSRAFRGILSRHERSSLVNVLSVLSWVSVGGSGYEVSKAAAWSATNAMRLALSGQGTTVMALHVGLMDTDMTRSFQGPKSDPRNIARVTVDAIISGEYEVLADDVSRQVKSQLSGDLYGLYPSLPRWHAVPAFSGPSRRST